MTTDELALLAAVLADPGDATPRLVYADWLDEHAGFEECTRCKDRGAVGWDYVNGMGNPPKVYTCPECTAPGYQPKPDGRAARAEFIRVQCELAGLREPPIGFKGCVQCDRATDYGEELCRYHDLRRREGELLGEHWPAWAGPILCRWHCDDLWPAKPTPTPCISFRRGFVERITCDWRTLAGGACGRCEGTGEIEAADPASGRTTGEWLTTCPACDGTGRTPGIADKLVWRAEVACPRCKDDKGRIETRPNKQVVHVFDACETCGFTGRVRNPAPPPPTAQPVREVVLTTRPEGESTGILGESVVIMRRGDGVCVWEFNDFPGVQFEMPPAGTDDLVE
jgi:uncharacterized protein (TIGR02996 family)